MLTTRGAQQNDIDAAFARLSYTTDLAEAAKDADIVSESIPENVDIKRSFYQELSEVAPEKTVFTTNSSTMLPSDIADATDRPEKFLALHFANGIWDANVGEVMGHPGTDAKYFDIVVDFARAIGMVPIPIHKEQNGYVLNALLVPWIQNGLQLLVDGVSDAQDIDRTWMISTGMTRGPFGIIDIIGLGTIYNIEMLWGQRNNDEGAVRRAEFLKENYIDKGKLGVKSGVGFYQYPNPEYQDPGFLE